jgi:putative oxidoreductase
MGDNSATRSVVSLPSFLFYPSVMRLLFQAYPGGVSGVGFLLLRASAALLVISLAAGYAAGGATSFAVSALAGALIIGIGTRPVAIMSTVIAIATLFGVSWNTALIHLGLAAGCSALVLIGPGAYSLDALRFGRKTIHVTRGGTPKP